MKEMRINRSNIGYSFVSYIVLFSSFAALISTTVQLYFEYKRDLGVIEKTAELVRTSHQSTIVQALWAYDIAILETQLAGIKNLPHVEYVRLHKEGANLLEVGAPPSHDKFIFHEYPLLHKPGHKQLRLGTLEVVISLSGIYRNLWERVVVIFITQALKTLLVSIFIFFLFYYLVGRHLKTMANFARSVHLKNLDDSLVLKRRSGKENGMDELDLVETALNSMRQNLIHEMNNVRFSQEALKKSEERFKLAMEVTRDGIWDWDIRTDAVYFSPGYAAMLGYDSVEVPPHVDSWLELIHPKDRERALGANMACIENRREQFSVEFRMVSKDNKWRWILGQGKAVERDDGGNAVRMIGTHTDITERKKAEEALRASEARLGSILQTNPSPVVLYDTLGVPRYISQSFTQRFGWTLEDIQGKAPFVPEGEEEIGPGFMEEVLKLGNPFQFLTKRRAKDDRLLSINICAAVYNDPGGEMNGLVVSHTDVTNQLKLEGQLRQAQKMEAVGRLAGGVAHDFNNMLGIILGNTELILEDLEPAHPMLSMFEEIRKAALRSTDLTRQLLAFARKQDISPRVLDLNRTIEGMLKILRRLIGEDIDLSWQPEQLLWPVKIDPSQVDQIMANLCVNARDAIKDVGKVTIETATAHFDDRYCREHEGFIPGDFSVIAVSDNGCGMEREILDNLFEPFFTTKALGEGTGLGLATVYGIVKQNSGFVNVYSEPGEGTVFKICLPREKSSLADNDRGPVEKEHRRGCETVLLVEDEKAILDMTKAVLERLGYTVLAAGTPDEALQLAGDRQVHIDLLMTDVVMPEMNGRDLAMKIRQSRPGAKCLFMSGYTANVITDRGILDEGLNFIGKPFSKRELSEKLRDILDE